MQKSIFSEKISSKYNGVRSCFQAFIETNKSVLSDFDFDARFWNYNLFILKLYACMHFFSLLVLHVHAHTSEEAAVPPVQLTAGSWSRLLIYDTSKIMTLVASFNLWHISKNNDLTRKLIEERGRAFYHHDTPLSPISFHPGSIVLPSSAASLNPAPRSLPRALLRCYARTRRRRPTRSAPRARCPCLLAGYISLDHRAIRLTWRCGRGWSGSSVPGHGVIILKKGHNEGPWAFEQV